MQNSEHLDLLWGAEAIADALGVSTRRAFTLLEGRQIPAKKVGGRWVAERSALRGFFLDAREAA